MIEKYIPFVELNPVSPIRAKLGIFDKGISGIANSMF